MCLFFVIPCQAKVLYVDVNTPDNNDGSSWAKAYKYLQDALADASSSGDVNEIWVAQGIYRPDETTNDPCGTGDRTATFQLINGVALRGGYDGYDQADPNTRAIEAYETILSGDLNRDDDPNFANNNENSYHVVTGSNTDANAILDGFAIRGGNANNSTLFPNDTGGGMLNLTGSPTVKNCTFSENYALTMGGGMYNRQGSSPTVTNCTFVENKSDDDGGGMRNYINSHPVISSCRFINNVCFEEGGGMGNRKNSNPLITDCIFVGNTAAGGGGIDSQVGKATPTGVPIVINCIFTSNSAIEGGGIRNNDPNLSATNCTFSSNIGSGMNNRDCTPTVTNCILWANTGGSFDGYGTPIVTFSNVEGGYVGTGNINTDPLFVDPNGPDGIIGTEDDNLRLSPDSPCIDAGDNTAVQADSIDLDNDGNTVEPIPYDHNGRDRFVDGDCNGVDIIDMGAYEFTYAYIGDFDGDCDVEFIDYSILAGFWLTDEFLVDISPSPTGDGIIDQNDLAVLCTSWLFGK
jgi:hypothetical protein